VAFPTTHWSVLAVATLNGDSAGRAALAKICAEYRSPVINFLRSRGHSAEVSEDLAQEFFMHLLESAAWKRADRARGRFRTFLLGALMHVLDHRREHEQAKKRGGGLAVESLDALVESGLEPTAIPPEVGRVFDREWALSLVEGALAGLEQEFTNEPRDAENYLILKRFLPGTPQRLSYEAAAETLGVPLATAKTWVHRVRRRFRERLRTAVAVTVSAPHEIDEELIYLRQILSESAETFAD